MAGVDYTSSIPKISDSNQLPAINDQVNSNKEISLKSTQHKLPPIDTSQASSITVNPILKTPVTPAPISSIDKKRNEKEKKIGHRRVDEQGQVTYKKIETSQICGSIQLGIGYAVGSLASKPERDLLMQDFAMVETTSFPNSGSNITPAHHYSDFKFKTYAPVAFRYFRDLFGIQPDDFLLSVCNAPMRELSNPGASGSVFYITDDDEFIIKTVQHKEAEFLQKLLPGYYMNLNQNPRTLLPKFFGLYCYICGGKNVRVCVMNNLLPTFIQLHQKYDLKGSTYKRKAGKYEQNKESPTYKDLDFAEHHPEGIFLEAETYNALMKTIQRDCRVLESFKIMDYSLLMGVHNLDQAPLDKQEKMRQKLAEVAAEAAAEARGRGMGIESGKIDTNEEEKEKPRKDSNVTSNLTRIKSINRQRLAAYSTAMESIQAEVEQIDEEDVPPGGIPARNSKGERILLFLGVIDILQSYRLAKKLEHTVKSMLTDGDTISVHRPSFYAQRFQDFCAKKVFKKIPSPLKHSPSKRKNTFQRMMKPTAISQSMDTAKLTTPNTNDKNKDVHSRVMLVTSTFQTSKGSVMTNPTIYNVPLSSHTLKSKPNQDSVPCLRTVVIKQAASKQHVTLPYKETLNPNHINLQTDSSSSVTSSSSATSGIGSTLRTVTWTPPLSIEGCTPTYTEGTPSLTESSESNDIVCFTTPVKSVSQKSPTSNHCSDCGIESYNLEIL